MYIQKGLNLEAALMLEFGSDWFKAVNARKEILK